MFFFKQHGEPYPGPQSLLIHPQVDSWVKHLDEHTFEIGWTVEAEAVTLYAGSKPEAIDHTRTMAHVEGAQKVIVSNVAATDRPYFELLFTGGAMDGRRIIVAERELTFRGAFNFRDLGGYQTTTGQRVRWGQVYRSGDLFGLTVADREALRKLRPKLICDLRTAREVGDRPNSLPGALLPVYCHVPVYQNDRTLQALVRLIFRRHSLSVLFRQWYRRVVEEKAPVFGHLLRQIADDENLPVVIHCTAGKDRTGIMTVLLLLLLGVPEEVVVADYTLSNLHFDTLSREAAKSFRSIGLIGLSIDELQPLLVADPENVRSIIRYFNEIHGSVEAYLNNAAGVDQQVVARLKKNLLV